MGPQRDLEKRSETNMEAAANKASGNFAKELEDELLKYTINHEDILKIDAPLVEKTEEVHKIADVEVNVTEFTNSGGNGISEVEYQDTTEYSSSFDGSDSGIENGNSEVASHFHGECTSALDFDGFGELFRMRKKKLNTHWRSFIQPLMWRCKWAELQIKKFQSQAQEYGRELAAYTQQKERQYGDLTMEDGARSIPFSCNNARGKVLRRKKRRKTEATTDVAAYMSRHNLFSYRENTKSFAEVAVMDDESRNPAIATGRVNIDDDFFVNDELQWLESRNSDNSLEHVLQKIVFLQAQVGKMKSRVDNIIRENAGKNSCTDDFSLLMPSDALVGYRNTASLSNNGDRMPVGSYISSQLLSAYNMDDIVKRETAGLSPGDVHDVIDSADQSLGDPCKTYVQAEDDVLIDNKRVMGERNNFEEVKNPAIRRPLVPKDGSGSTIRPVLSNDLATNDQPLPILRCISKLTAPKTRRKRGRRKGSGPWDRRS